MDVYFHDIRYVEDECGERSHIEIFAFTHDSAQIIRIHDFQFYLYVEQTAEVLNFLKRRFSESIELCALRKMFGYHPEPTPLVKVSMRSMRMLSRVKFALMREFPSSFMVNIWEEYVDPVLRFMQVTGKTVGKWYRWPHEDLDSTCTRDVINAELMDMTKGEQYMSHPDHLITMSFDLETSGLVVRRGDTINIIGMTFRNGSGSYQRKVGLHLHHVNPRADETKQAEAGPDGGAEEPEPLPTTYIHEGVEFHSCVSETQMLLKFREIVVRERVSMIVGFNTTMFDWDFLFVRAQLLNVPPDFYRLSWWCPNDRAELADVRLRDFAGRKTLSVPGVHSIDVLLMAFGQMKLDSYTLNAVAEEVLGSNMPQNQKHEVSLEEMLSCGLPSCKAATRLKVGLYCIQDCDLVMRIVLARDYVNITYESASRSFVLPNHFLYRGITYRITSLLMHHAQRKKFVYNIPKVDFDARVPDGSAVADDGDPEDGASSSKPKKEKYKGGFVVKPKVGAHQPVAIADFASLYPSQILQYNFCPSQLLTKEQAEMLPPEEVRKVCIDEDRPDDPTKYVYTHIPKDPRESILPEIQQGLYADRAYWKKIMKKYEPGTPGYKCADANQQSVKVLMNAIYGAMALISQPVAECITAMGRQTIRRSIQLAVERFGVELIYGDTDSMMIKIPGVTSIETPEERQFAFDKLKEITDAVTQFWLENAYPPREKPVVVLEPEAICRGYWQGKKMYAIKKYGSPSDTKAKFTIKGLTPGRRDTPQFVRQGVFRFLDKLVDQEFEECYNIVREVIAFIQRSCDNPPTPEVLKDFSLTCSFKSEEQDKPSPAVVVVNRRRSRAFDTAKYSVGSMFEIGDRVPYVAISPETREQLLYHVLKVRGLPIGSKARLDKVEFEIPAPNKDGWQLIGFKKKLQFGPDPQSNVHRRLTLHIDGLSMQACKQSNLDMEQIYLDGMRVDKVEWKKSMKSNKAELQMIFRVTESSIALCAEDIEFVDPTVPHMLDYNYYMKRFASPIEAAVKALHAANIQNRFVDKIFSLCQNAQYRNKRKMMEQSRLDSFFAAAAPAAPALSRPLFPPSKKKRV